MLGLAKVNGLQGSERDVRVLKSTLHRAASLHCKIWGEDSSQRKGWMAVCLFWVAPGGQMGGYSSEACFGRCHQFWFLGYIAYSLGCLCPIYCEDCSYTDFDDTYLISYLHLHLSAELIHGSSTSDCAGDQSISQLAAVQVIARPYGLSAHVACSILPYNWNC